MPKHIILVEANELDNKTFVGLEGENFKSRYDFVVLDDRPSNDALPQRATLNQTHLLVN